MIFFLVKVDERKGNCRHFFLCVSKYGCIVYTLVHTTTGSRCVDCKNRFLVRKMISVTSRLKAGLTLASQPPQSSPRTHEYCPTRVWQLGQYNRPVRFWRISGSIHFTGLIKTEAEHTWRPASDAASKTSSAGSDHLEAVQTGLSSVTCGKRLKAVANVRRHFLHLYTMG